MKKNLLIAFCLICMTACADEKCVITFNDLPKVSQKLLTQYINPQDVLIITREGSSQWAEYEVKLNDQSEWEFDAKGQLEKVELLSGVPTALLPSEVVHYVQNNYPKAVITQFSKSRRNYEVELNNGLELKFDLKGRLVEID